MGRLGYLAEKVKELRDEGLEVEIPEIGSPQGAWFLVNGKRMLNLCSNNYLGLAGDPQLVAAAAQAAREWGAGPGAVRTIAGTQTLHLRLEEELARFKRTEEVLLFQSGFAANLGTIPAVVGEGDVIFSDELNHASIIDGCRLSRAQIVRYPHCDADALEKRVREWREKASGSQRGLIVTDGVFSMDGDIAPLDALVEVAERYELPLMVDDAHGEGVLGEQGRGVVNHFGLEGRVDVEVGTLSKAFGVVGGYVAGTGELCAWLRQRARPFLFSTGLAPADVGAAIESVRILAASDELVRKLWDNCHLFQGLLREYGFDLGRTQTPITPILVGDENVSNEFSRGLYERGIFVQSIVYPTVPLGRARLRAMVSACHSEEDLRFAAATIREVGSRLGLV